ncbi:hypothetical protein [Bacillus coahuilensis]
MPITITVFLFFIPILFQVVRFLGIIDLGFNLRQRLQHK